MVVRDLVWGIWRVGVQGSTLWGRENGLGRQMPGMKVKVTEGYDITACIPPPFRCI